MLNACSMRAGRYVVLAFLSGSLLVVQGPLAKAQDPQVFENPTLQGMRIDRCLTWATNCDEPAASVFCRYQGYSRAVDWQWEYASPTLVQGDGQICDVANACGAFTQISCQ